MPQVRQGPLDTAIAPGRMLVRHADNELLDLLSDPRAATLMALRASVELLRDQPLVPAQEGVRRGNRRDLFEALTAKRVGERRAVTALGVGQAQPAPAKLGVEHAVFRAERRHNRLLVPLEPPGDHGDQNVEDHSAPQVGVGGSIMRSSLHSTRVTSIG